MMIQNNNQSRLSNQSFEQNKQQIQQTHDIINVIENKLNNFLQKRGVKQTSPDTYKLSVQQSYQDSYSPERIIEHKIQYMEQTMEGRTFKLQSSLTQLENENRQLAQQNLNIHQENRTLKQNVREIEIAQKRHIEDQLDQQRQQLQKQFELQVNDIGDNAKSRLLQSLEQEDKYLNQYNRVIEDKSHLQNQLDQLRIKNQGLQDERDNLTYSYSNLLTMHNQMLKLDVTQNQSQIDNIRMRDQIYDSNSQPEKGQLMVTLSQYKDELDQLKHVNENIQEHMSKELQDLRDELDRQKMENADLMREMSSLKVTDESGTARQRLSERKDLNELYQQVFKHQSTKPQKVVYYEEDEDVSLSQSQQIKPPTSARKQRERIQKVQKKNKESSRSKSKSKSLRKIDDKVVPKQKIQQPEQQKASKLQTNDNKIRIQKFEQELNRLKDIVNDKIVNKRRRKPDQNDDE